MGDVRGKDVLRVAKKLGYSVRPPKKRKHYVILDGPRIVTTVPKGRIKKGTLDSIIKDLGITKQEFNRLL
ncbi:MAG: type II toxin-antitoxin system HicA family toxin [Desulfobacterales bacterium]|nr:type II toxin-antitoxin system HicA family toxin [Desulfobacterales bacterium]